MSNRIQRALARRERMRRSRDYAWIVFAAAAAAAAIGWFLLLDHVISDVRKEWSILLICAAIGVGSTYVAFRAFGASMRLGRRVSDAHLMTRDEHADDPGSVWQEIWGRRRS